jgi:hypothetical protein
MGNILQYNREYYKALQSEDLDFVATIKDPNQENEIKHGNSKRKKTGFFNLGGDNLQKIQRGLHNAIKIGSKAADDNLNLDFAINNNPIFRKNIALEKVLSKFFNKTY